MVLAGLGRERTEVPVRAVCDCMGFGPKALKVVDAMRQLGFLCTTKHTCALEELCVQFHGGQWPAV
jgi:hypothetical protein